MMSATSDRTNRSPGVVPAVARGLWLAVVIVLGVPALVSAFAQPPALGREADGLTVASRDAATTRDESEAKRAAAATVDRLRARFRETLDFAPIVDEMFVDGASRRDAILAGFTGDVRLFGGDAKLAKSLDDYDVRRGYVAFLNVSFLGEAYSLATSEPGEGGEIPPVVEREMLASPYFRVLLVEEDGTLPALESREDVLRWIADMEAIAGAYRRVVSTHTFDSPTYVANRARLEADPDRVDLLHSDRDSGYVDFGVPEGETVCEVNRDGVWYSLVEQDGVMKVLAVEIETD